MQPLVVKRIKEHLKFGIIKLIIIEYWSAFWVRVVFDFCFLKKFKFICKNEEVHK